jgi:hypothetical protein
MVLPIETRWQTMATKKTQDKRTGERMREFSICLARHTVNLLDAENRETLADKVRGGKFKQGRWVVANLRRGEVATLRRLLDEVLDYMELSRSWH